MWLKVREINSLEGQELNAGFRYVPDCHPGLQADGKVDKAREERGVRDFFCHDYEDPDNGHTAEIRNVMVPCTRFARVSESYDRKVSEV